MLNKFETEDISKLLVQFSLPAIAGMIIHSCYNIVSRMFVGNMGNDGHLGLAGLAVVFPVMLLFFSICVLFGLGGANLYSIKLGEKKYDEAEIKKVINFKDANMMKLKIFWEWLFCQEVL